MDLDTRKEILTPERRQDLDCLVAARMDVAPASRKIVALGRKPVQVGSFRTRIKRLALRLHFQCVTDMMVWYELEYKGPANAEKWRRRVARFDSLQPEDHSGLRYLIAVLAVERDGDADRVRRVAADVGCNEVTIGRALRRFAETANIYYSLDWLSFVYAVYTKLQETSREMVAV